MKRGMRPEHADGEVAQGVLGDRDSRVAGGQLALASCSARSAFAFWALCATWEVNCWTYLGRGREGRGQIITHGAKLAPSKRDLLAPPLLGPREGTEAGAGESDGRERRTRGGGGEERGHPPTGPPPAHSLLHCLALGLVLQPEGLVLHRLKRREKEGVGRGREAARR